jgi:AAA15 family ATPase/GTPase
MNVEITIKNYRCFSDEQPAQFTLRNGSIAFVGPNNAGKSSLLRFFYEFRRLFDHLTTANRGPIMNALKGKSDFERNVPDVSEMFCDSNYDDLSIEFRFTETSIAPSGLEYPRLLVIKVDRDSTRWTAAIELQNRYVNLADTPIEFKGTVLWQGSPIADFAAIFELFGHLSNTFYIASFRNVLSLVPGEDYYDIKVGESFIQNWNLLKNGLIKKHSQVIESTTEAIREIFEFKKLEINASEDKKTLRVNVNSKPFKMNELGSGLAHFILTLGSVAMKEPRPSFLLIDEPELSLHPSLQLTFLTNLATYSTKGVIFATHSLRLARSAADQIYTVRRANDHSEVMLYDATPRLPELLGELNFPGYRELGYKKILLVEGRTEIKTVHQFLRLYHKDHEILVMPLNGDNLINDNDDTQRQLEELKRISSDLFALIDSERSKKDEQLPSKNRRKFVELCQKLKIGCHVLDRRSIENYFLDQHIKTVMGPNRGRSLLPFEDCKEFPGGWDKSQNWKIARQMNRDDLEQTDLGNFIKTLCE